MKKKLKRFVKKLHHGLKQEYNETKAIPKHIKNKEYKQAIEQVSDLGRMTFLSFLWILPGGGVISGFLVKFSDKIRPSAFRKKEEKSNAKK